MSQGLKCYRDYVPDLVHIFYEREGLRRRKDCGNGKSTFEIKTIHIYDAQDWAMFALSKASIVTHPCTIHGCGRLIWIRFLSSTRRSITSLLKEFYSKTHPDLFGPYPEARQQNEQSLKTLTQHLESLQSKAYVDHHAPAPRLKFFVKGSRGKDRISFRCVETTLSNTSVNDSIFLLFKACG